MKRRIQIRLMVFFCALSLVSVLLVSGLLYLLSRKITIQNEIQGFADQTAFTVYRSYSITDQRALLSFVLKTQERVPSLIYLGILDSKGVTVADAREERLDKKWFSNLVEKARSSERLAFSVRREKEGLVAEVAAPILSSTGVLFGLLHFEKRLETIGWMEKQFTTALVWLLALTLSLNVAISFFLARQITRPINHLVSATELVSTGDLTPKISILTSDELGTLARAFKAMIGSLSAVVRGVRESSQEISSTSQELLSTSEDLARSITGIHIATEEIAQEFVSQNERNDRTAQELRGFLVSVDEIAKGAVIQSERISQSHDNIKKILEYLKFYLETIRTGVQSRKDIGETLEQLKSATQTVQKAPDVKALATVLESLEEVAAIAEENASRCEEMSAAGQLFQIILEEFASMYEKSRETAQRITETTDEQTNRTMQILNLVENFAIQARKLDEAVQVFRVSSTDDQSVPSSG